MSPAIAVADTRDGELCAGTGQALAAARLLAGADGSLALLIVAPEPAGLAAAASFEGVERLLTVEAGSGTLPSEVAAAAASAARETAAEAIVFAHGPDAMAAAPALAVELGAALVTDVTAIAAGGSGSLLTRSLYGGKVAADLALPAGVPAVVTVRSGSFTPPGEATPPTPEPLAAPDPDPAYEHLGYLVPDSGNVDITRAELLVAAGRGIGERENLEQIEAVAAAFGGELAASRPLVDAGWVPASRQVGQSGRTVEPKVYLAFGISGAVQHLAGIRDAGVVIAVNSDPEAPIFRVADYGAVADAVEVAESLERVRGG
ncbi:MAG: electron transfer flavoprotein subunit alpha/FixB family protein [Actinobacteria bacterium]|nr:electron transfer flavoprotein subunit alpha/FixB family protein [Actinomycetota bacterium]